MKLGDILVFVLVGFILLILLPILLPLIVLSYFQERIDRLRFAGYLKANEGAKFFAYTNKQSSQKYVETEILPFLPKDVQVLFLSGKGRINLGDEHKFTLRIIWSMKAAKGGFPYVSKVANGELVTESANNRLHSAIRRGVGSEKILKQIEKFFSRDR